MTNKTENDLRQQINALREMDVNEYEGAVDSLIKALEAAGVFEKYEQILLEIDDSFDEDFASQFDEMTNVIGNKGLIPVATE